MTPMEMARKAVNYLPETDYEPIMHTKEQIERFAALVSEDAREFYDDLIFNRIKAWSKAYPLSIFPEPDFKKAHEVLQANGMTLDAISASNMRHVITQIQSMIDDAIRARSEK